MAAHYSKKDLADIVRLKDIEGLTHKEIASQLGRPNARAVMNQYKKAKAAGVLSSFGDITAPESLEKEDTTPAALAFLYWFITARALGSPALSSLPS